MKLSKELIEKLAVQSVRNLSIWNVDNEIYKDLDVKQITLIEIEESIQIAIEHCLTQLVVMTLPTRERAWCQLPRNEEWINKSVSVHCQDCDMYFCKSHHMRYCPFCGLDL